jgi:chromate transporter
MPGPLAAQLAIALGYFRHGVVGATAVGLAFCVPSFLMVVAISAAYVRFGGLWWMQALFYGIGAAVIAIIAIAAYKLSRSTNKRDPLLWAIFGALAIITVWAQAELAEVFVAAGLVVVFARAWPGARRGAMMVLGGLAVVAVIWLIERWFLTMAVGGQDVLLQILLFFTKAGSFVFGSGLAIVPFLHQGVVQQFGWLNEQQFLDAVAVAMITPGPVVITVVFIGFLVAGLLGAIAAALVAQVTGTATAGSLATVLIGTVVIGVAVVAGAVMAGVPEVRAPLAGVWARLRRPRRSGRPST